MTNSNSKKQPHVSTLGSRINQNSHAVKPNTTGNLRLSIKRGFHSSLASCSIASLVGEVGDEGVEGGLPPFFSKMVP